MALEKLSDDQVTRLLNSAAQERGNSFRVKVSRRPSAAGLPVNITTFDEATVDQIVSPEQWLPALAGGGIYTLTCYHQTAPTEAIGSLGFSFNSPPREVNPIVAGIPGWKGPSKLIFPEAPQPDAPPSQIHIPPAQQPQHQGYSQAPAATPWARMPQIDPVQQMELQAERERLATTSKRLDDERHQMELDRLRREANDKMRDLEAKIANVATAAAAPQPQKSSSLTEIAAVVTSIASSIVLPFLSSQSEARRDQAERERLAREESNRREEARHAESQALLMKVIEKPATDPALEKVLNRLEQIEERVADPGVAGAAEMMHSLMKTATSMIKLASDAALGGEKKGDHPVVSAIREGVAAVTTIINDQANKPKFPQQRQLPAAIPLAQPAPRGQTQPQPPPTGTPSPPNTVDILEGMVKSEQPVATVAAHFVDALKRQDRFMVQEINACGGDPQELFARRCGAWVMASADHQNYAKALLEELDRQGAAAGIFDEIIEEEAPNVTAPPAAA